MGDSCISRYIVDSHSSLQEPSNVLWEWQKYEHAQKIKKESKEKTFKKKEEKVI